MIIHSVVTVDHHYLRHERLVLRLAVFLMPLIVVVAVLLSLKFDHRNERISESEVWSFIEQVSRQKGLDPEFVYALAWAESSLNAKARSSVARGIMQLTKPAWQEVSDESYRLAWDWRTNIRVATDYLIFCRDFLIRHDAFTYPLLAACYRYGPYHVKMRDFDLTLVEPPINKIYQAIFAGNICPVRPPEQAAAP